MALLQLSTTSASHSEWNTYHLTSFYLFAFILCVLIVCSWRHCQLGLNWQEQSCGFWRVSWRIFDSPPRRTIPCEYIRTYFFTVLMAVYLVAQIFASAIWMVISVVWDGWVCHFWQLTEDTILYMLVRPWIFVCLWSIRVHPCPCIPRSLYWILPTIWAWFTLLKTDVVWYSYICSRLVVASSTRMHFILLIQVSTLLQDFYRAACMRNPVTNIASECHCSRNESYACDGNLSGEASYWIEAYVCSVCILYGLVDITASQCAMLWCACNALRNVHQRVALLLPHITTASHWATM